MVTSGLVHCVPAVHLLTGSNSSGQRAILMTRQPRNHGQQSGQRLAAVFFFTTTVEERLKKASDNASCRGAVNTT